MLCIVGKEKNEASEAVLHPPSNQTISSIPGRNCVKRKFTSAVGNCKNNNQIPGESASSSLSVLRIFKLNSAPVCFGLATRSLILKQFTGCIATINVMNEDYVQFGKNRHQMLCHGERNWRSPMLKLSLSMVPYKRNFFSSS